MGFCFSCCRRQRPDKQAQAQAQDVERQPLLRSDTNALKQHPGSRTPYEKVADVLAALHAGKLPSQQQLEDALRKLLRSGLLEGEREEDGGALDEGTRKVVHDAREVVEVLLQVGLEKNDDNRVQDLVYQLRELSMPTLPMKVEEVPQVQVNNDTADKVQAAASAIPSQNELASDTLALVSSLRTLATLLLTSSAFRLIIGDLLLTARQFIADTAVQVRRVAETVEHVSEVVETNIRPDSERASIPPITTDIKSASNAEPDPAVSESKSPKEVTLNRLEDVFRRAQASPQYNSALRMLLYIFRKYAERVRLASTALSEAAQSSSGESSVQVTAPVIVPDPRFSRALEDLEILLERFAGGKSLEPSLQILFKTVHDISVIPAGGDSSEVQIFFCEVGQWLDTALVDSSFATSQAGRDTASKLYDDAYTLLSQDTQLSKNVHQLLNEVNAFVESLKSDRSTNKLVEALDKLHTDVLFLLGRTADSSKRAVTHWQTTLLRAVVGWALPRLLRAIRVLPMPRFEYVSSSSDGTRIEAAIDALLLSAEEALVPDVLSVQEFTEVRVEVDESIGAAELTSPNARLLSARTNANQGDLENSVCNLLSPDESDGTGARTNGKQTHTTTTSRVRTHVEGLRVAAHDVGYYVSYSRNSWLGYTDEGLLSVKIGRERQKRGEGLVIDVELELDSDFKQQNDKGSENGMDERLFRVLDVRTAIPGLELRIEHSRHWVLNSLLAPLAGTAGRRIGPYVLNAQIRNALELLEKFLGDVKNNADERARYRAKELHGETQVIAADWWDAFLEKFGSGKQDEEADEGDEDEEGQEVYTETQTEANLTGIVRTTIEQPEPEAQSDAPPPTDSALAVGLGAQLLPGRAEPSELGVERESPQEMAQEVAAEGREAVEDIQGKVKSVREGVQNAGRRGIEEAIRVRRMAEDAEERIERQERREKKRRGWKSRAFDL